MKKKLSELLKRLSIKLKKSQTNTGSETLLKKELIYSGKNKNKTKRNMSFHPRNQNNIIQFPKATNKEVADQDKKTALSVLQFHKT